jgi:hypothetical protein
MNFSPAAQSIGLGGSLPGEPESDEERRKRLLAQQQQRLLPNTSLAGGYGAALSPAAQSINLGT